MKKAECELWNLPPARPALWILAVNKTVVEVNGALFPVADTDLS
jgi:hypothetical protein